ncbi:hypothetical protein [Bacillus sp. FSL K6-3431]|uniref:hypothetical protein n=1 Tax=Bacillus sp. FSL K6-3431 TaxID=2921500 RepID=UPI0030F62A90
MDEMFADKNVETPTKNTLLPTKGHHSATNNSFQQKNSKGTRRYIPAINRFLVTAPAGIEPATHGLGNSLMVLQRILRRFNIAVNRVSSI